MAINIFDDVTEQKRDELDRALALGGQPAAWSASLDYETTLDNVAHLAVPLLADWCAVDLVDDRGELRQVALAHADPSKIETLERMRERYPPSPTRRAWRRERDALRRAAALRRDLRTSCWSRSVENEEHLSMLRKPGSRSAIVVPMRTRGRHWGRSAS